MGGGGVELQEKEGKQGDGNLGRKISALVQVLVGLFLKAHMKADSR